MFQTEFELVDFFIANSKQNNKYYIRELPTNFGRPDIIELTINKTLLANRKNKEDKIPQIQRIDTYIITFLKGKSFVKKKTILSKLNLNSTVLNASINRLQNREMIEQKGDYIKLKSIKELLFISSLTVYEAKLTNWKYVIEQAERHLWFSNQSFILLPDLSEEIKRKAIILGKERGVGVAITNGDKIVYKTKKVNKLINTPLLWEINEGIIDGKFEIE